MQPQSDEDEAHKSSEATGGEGEPETEAEEPEASTSSSRKSLQKIMEQVDRAAAVPVDKVVTIDQELKNWETNKVKSDRLNMV